MTRQEYAEMVEYIEDRWGRVEAWANAAHVYGDFEEIPAEACWEVLKLRLTGNPEKARWAPNPAELHAASLDWQRPRIAQKALPESTDTMSWPDYSQLTYGRYIPVSELVELKARGEEPEHV